MVAMNTIARIAELFICGTKTGNVRRKPRVKSHQFSSTPKTKRRKEEMTCIATKNKTYLDNSCPAFLYDPAEPDSFGRVFDTMDNCNRCGKEAHHTHHKDHNHRNNEPSNLERLCTLCHSKEHEIEPKLSELKELVIYYEKVQKAKITIGNSIKSFERIEIDPPQELVGEYKKLREIENQFEKKISNYWKENTSAIYEWMVGIKGIGDVLAAKLLGKINFKNTPSVASLWAYAGLAPNSKKRRGTKANWNQSLKRDCFQLVDCFIKQRTPKYRDIYDREKEKQIANGLKKGHAHNRAIRKAAKVFLRNLFIEVGRQ